MNPQSIRRHIEDGDLIHTALGKADRKVSNIRKTVRKKIHGDRRVAVIGWIGAFNLGDEMMLQVTLENFFDLGIRPTLITHKDDEEVLSRYNGAIVIPRRPLTDENIEKILASNDALFINGGALIDDRDYDNPDSLARDISRLSKVFIDAGKKVVVYGISTNSDIQNADAINDYRFLIDHAFYFSVRDEFSKKELSKIGDGEKIHLVDDIVFASEIFKKKHEPKNDGGRITIIPMFDKDSTEGVKSLIKKTLETSRSDIRVVLFYDETFHESRSLEELLQDIGYDRYRVKEVIMPRNAEELAAALGDSRLVVSMRYHGTLFAGAYGKRVLRLDHNKHPHYQFKNKYLASEYGYGVDYVNVTDVPDMPAESLRGIMDRVTMQNTQSSRVIYKRARANLRKVIKLL